MSGGIDAVMAARHNVSGEFWASKDARTSDIFAMTNPAGGTPARFAFDISQEVLDEILAIRPPVTFVYPPQALTHSITT
jgi:hypothetical protein